MINANELRIGNWIKIIGSYNPQTKSNVECVQVKSINEDGVNLFPAVYGGEGYIYAHAEFNQNIESIPLTREVLRKCDLDIRIYDYTNPPTYIVDLINKEIKYVHELQNIYFTLTGKELELNLTESWAAEDRTI